MLVATKEYLASFVGEDRESSVNFISAAGPDPVLLRHDIGKHDFERRSALSIGHTSLILSP